MSHAVLREVYPRLLGSRPLSCAALRVRVLPRDGPSSHYKLLGKWRPGIFDLVCWERVGRARMLAVQMRPSLQDTVSPSVMQEPAAHDLGRHSATSR